MKNFKKLLVVCLSTVAFSSNILANEFNIDQVEVKNEIAISLNTAMANIKQPAVQEIAKLHLLKMAAVRNAEQYLTQVAFENDITTAKLVAVSE